MRTYVVLQSGQIELLQAPSAVDGAQFRTDYAKNANQPASIKSDGQGNTTVTVDPFAAFHFWPSAGRADFDPRNVKGVIVALEAKIDLKDGQTADQVDHNLILSVGADYWLARNSPWDNYRTNVGVGMGQFRYIGADWRCFTMTTIGSNDPLISTQVLC
jgi:hypothetical protein